MDDSVTFYPENLNPVACSARCLDYMGARQVSFNDAIMSTFNVVKFHVFFVYLLHFVQICVLMSL